MDTPVHSIYYHHFYFNPGFSETETNIKNELYKVKYSHKARGNMLVHYPTLGEFVIIHGLRVSDGIVYGVRRAKPMTPVLKKLKPRTVNFD